MPSPARPLLLFFLVCPLLLLGACASTPGLSYAPTSKTQLAGYPLSGDTGPVHDPSLLQQNGTFYSLSSDTTPSPSGSFLAMRCSRDRVAWSACGKIFTTRPAWLDAKIGGVGALWAPDMAFFNGLYHVYYAASTSGSQNSVIALATNTTLDPADPAYRWVDRGAILASHPGDDFNAIDPNIFVDADGSVWLTYGSYWSGIKQMQLDPVTGLVLAGSPRYDLATRPSVPSNPIEGPSLVRHGQFYYLFVSVEYCCNQTLSQNNYKQAVGRGLTPHGPFLDMAGTPMMQGGGTVLLEGNELWAAPGGGSALVDPVTGESTLVFHALNVKENGALYLWAKHINWTTGWPVLTPVS